MSISYSINSTLNISAATRVLFTGYTLNPLDGGGKATLYINGKTAGLTNQLINNNQFLFDLIHQLILYQIQRKR